MAVLDLHLRLEGADLNAAAITLLNLLSGDATMAEKLSALKERVRANRDVTESAKLAFAGLVQRLRDAAATAAADDAALRAEVTALIAEVDADSADLAAAITEGTPAAEPPAPNADEGQDTAPSEGGDNVPVETPPAPPVDAAPETPAELAPEPVPDAPAPVDAAPVAETPVVDVPVDAVPAEPVVDVPAVEPGAGGDAAPPADAPTPVFP